MTPFSGLGGLLGDALNQDKTLNNRNRFEENIMSSVLKVEFEGPEDPTNG